MRMFALAAVTAVFLIPAPSFAGETGAATDISAQTVRIGPGGVSVGPDHRRWESRRARRGRDRCRTITVTETRPSGRVVRRTVRRCD